MPCMGVIYFLICVRKHESNLPTNICATAGKILLQHCVFSFTRVCIFLPMVFIMTLITTLCFYDFWKTALVKNTFTHLSKVWFDFPLPNAIFFTLAFKWYFTYIIEAPLSLRTNCKKSRGRCPRAPARAYAPRTLRTKVLKN